MQGKNITARQVNVQHGAAPAPLAAIPGLGNVVSTFALAGPCDTNELKLSIVGLQLTTANPAVVLMQPRQNDNADFGFPDEFAVIVNTTSADHLLVTIKRLDGDSGWAQNLRVDMLIIDQVNNP